MHQQQLSDKSSMKAPLAKAVRLAGGPAAVGRLYTPPISSQAVSQWTRCPAERVRALAAATGGQVSEVQLRPDLYGGSDAAANQAGGSSEQVQQPA